MRAFVDQDMCIGCGLCEGTCPEVFRMNDAGKAEAYADCSWNLSPLSTIRTAHRIMRIRCSMRS